MTVHVTMLVSSLPDGFPHDERTVDHTDLEDSKYTYSLHSSGALIVYRTDDKLFPETEIVYGPSAWESVQGDPGTGR